MIAYVESVVTLFLLYGLLCLSFDILAGDLRLISLATPAMAGVGAYAAAIADVTWGWSMPGGFLAAIVASGAIGLILAAMSLRVAGVYFFLVTMSLGLILVTAFDQMRSITNGPSGIRGVSPFEIPGLTILQSGIVVAGALCAGIGTGVWFLRRSYLGRRWRALGEDRLAAANVGISRAAELIKAVTLSGAIAGAAGFTHAHVIGLVNPTPFDLTAAILVLSFCIVGGLGRVSGALVGAGVGVLLPEILRFIPLGDAVSQQPLIRQLVFGLLLFLFLAIRPTGLLGRSKTSAGSEPA